MNCLDWINTTDLYQLVLQPKNIPLPVLFAIINHDRKAGPMLAPAYFLPSMVRGYKIICLQFKNLWKTFEIPNIYPLYYLMINRNIFDITCIIHNVTSKQNSIHFGTCVKKCFNSLWSSAAAWHGLLLILTEVMACWMTAPNHCNFNYNQWHSSYLTRKCICNLCL